MTDTKKLLELRNKIKKKKPLFIRQDAHKHKRLGRKWRKPKGIQSKMRLRRRGYRKSVSVGYRSPENVRYFDKSEFKKCLISSLKDLKTIDGKKQGIIIASYVGLKKKIDIIKEAQKLSIRILNIKDPNQFLKNIEDKLKKQKEEKQKLKQEKQKKLKKREEKAKEKVKEKEEKEKKGKEKSEDLAEKIKKEEEEKKKEKDKVLTKKTI